MESLVLSPQDVENLEAMSDGSTGYFYKMLDYLEKRVEDGVRRGRFSEEAAKADLETALWYSYACNNLDEYESYCRAAQWMAASEGSAEAARCGMWYYRYSCALLYCGRLEEALAYAEKGVAVEPDYVWGWLQLGKLRSHFGDTAGALAAVERGLALEPGDYEFTTLAREIREGRSLEEMEYHWIDPEQDRRLQAGEAEEGEMADKRLAIACILCDRANLEAVKAALGVTEWEADAPYCTFTMPYGEGTVQGRFFGNEAALSKLSAEWAAALAARLPELDRRGRTFLELRAELQTDGLELAWFTIQRDHWGIPCMTEPEDGEDGESTLVFEVEGMLAALSLYPFPVPHGEAEEAAGRCYLWPEAEAAARRHKGQLLVSVLGREAGPWKAAALQVKLVCAACGQAGTLGVYANGTVYPPELYQEAAAPLDEGELPLLNLVWVGLYRTEEGMGAYTDGLRSFGKDELEVLDARAEPAEVRNFLLNIADYLLEEDVTLRDGETIGFSEEQRLPITRSAGVGQEGMTLKIGWPGEV